MRGWGWGEDERAPALPAGAEGLLRSELGLDGTVVAPPVALGDVALPEPALDEPSLGRLRQVVGAEHVLQDREARVRRAAGCAPATARVRRTPW